MKPQSYSNPEDQAPVPGNEIANHPSETGQSEPSRKYDGHTPGPWRIYRGGLEGNISMVADLESDTYVVVEGYVLGDPLKDAALIADAPLLLQQRDELANVMDLVAAKFREYERLHLNKNTGDGDRKAAANRAFAEMCEVAIAHSRS